MAAIMLTLDECAELANCNPRDISAEIGAGRLPAMRIGRRYRIRRVDFDAWVDAEVKAHTERMTEPKLIPLPPYRSGRKRKAVGA